MTSTPHDSLFKSVFSQVEHAAGMLRALLPPELVQHIDFRTLALCPGSFVDEALKERHTDLLFSALVGGRPALFYFLIEHQSSQEDLMGFRLLRYEVRIWEGWLSENAGAKRLPAIIPLVVHHSEGGWTGEVAFEALLDVDAELFEAVAPYVPRFRFVLEDLSGVSEDALQRRAMSALGRLALWCLKNARTPVEIAQRMRGWADLVREVARAPHGMAALVVIFRYIFLVSERLKPAELRELLTGALGEEGQEAMASVADQIRAEGRREGRHEGRAEGRAEERRELLLKLLNLRFGELPKGARERVNAADPALLERWVERVLFAETLKEVLEST